MMRYIRLFLILVLVVVLVTLATSNGQSVDLTLFPSWVPWIGGTAITAPLFVFIYGALIAGVILGEIYEYFRSLRLRRQAAKSAKALQKTEAELEKIKQKTGNHDDPVLAMLK